MNPDISSLDLTTTVKALLENEFSALDLVEACLHQIERLNPKFNAFITPTPEIACQQAMSVDAILNLRPANLRNLTLLGLPFALKDLFDSIEVITTAGSRQFNKDYPLEDAEAVLKIKNAGAITVGKTNMHEIALGVTNVNPFYGPCRNPWNSICVSGGSSGGSAVSVATGMSLAALGTDTGGSIRIPAAFCGVVGLKPTFGRVSKRGVISLSWNLDHVGPITRTAEDAALILSVLAGFDPHDPASMDIPVDDYSSRLKEGIRGWRVAVASGEYIDVTDSEIMSTIETAVNILKDMGASLEKVNVSWLAKMAAANTQMTQADGAAFHHERLMMHPESFGEDVRERLLKGAALTASEYSLARHVQTESCRYIDKLFEKYDLLILPTTPIPAPFIEGTHAIEAARQLTRFTSPFNLVGVPALSIPCGFTASGLPVGLQIVTKRWGESKVLQAGYAYQQVTDWHKRHPNL